MANDMTLSVQGLEMKSLPGNSSHTFPPSISPYLLHHLPPHQNHQSPHKTDPITHHPSASIYHPMPHQTPVLDDVYTQSMMPLPSAGQSRQQLSDEVIEFAWPSYPISRGRLLP
ncbi:unnamed protein product, partial [Protopolystoma xenopodis]